jgi:hypothetical protein
VASTWYSDDGYQFEADLQRDRCSLLCDWNQLTAFRDIGYLCVGDLVHLVHHDRNDRLGLTVALKQDQRGKGSEGWSFVLFVWMISQKELESQGLIYRLAAGKTHLLSNWCQVVPFNYVEAVPDCHTDADINRIETSALFDVSRKTQDGYFKVRDFDMKKTCILSKAIHCVSKAPHNLELNSHTLRDILIFSSHSNPFKREEFGIPGNASGISSGIVIRGGIRQGSHCEILCKVNDTKRSLRLKMYV